MRKSSVKFNAKALANLLMKDIVKEQNALLIDYAKNKIVEIGDMIKTYHSKNNMDRTGHLLNSLLWGVSYQGKLVKGGFYRQARVKGVSYLHEWMSGDTKYLIPVDGRALAQQYLQSYGNNGARGWRVFFAILAPYWGYWEKGHVNHRANRVLQFAVMTEFYDQVKAELKPARVRFRVSVPKYMKDELDRKWNKYANID
jgi:hypothetical protein